MLLTQNLTFSDSLIRKTIKLKKQIRLSDFKVINAFSNKNRKKNAERWIDYFSLKILFLNKKKCCSFYFKYSIDYKLIIHL